MLRILRAGGTAALALALLVPTAAHADRWSGTDETGDVEGWHYDPEPEPCGTSTDVDGAAQANEDFTRLGVRHTRRSVVVTAKFRDLDAELEQMVTVYIRTPRGGFWLDLVRYQARSGKWRVITFLAEAPRYPDPDDVDECGGFGFFSWDIGCRKGRELNFAEDYVRLTVPRTCIENPRWVRIGADSSRFVEPEDPSDESFTVFSDEWDGGTVLTKWKISYGPRVHATAGAATEVRRQLPTRTGERRHVVVLPDGIFARR